MSRQQHVRRAQPAASWVVLPLADHGDVVSALPFVVPMLVVVAGLLFLVARDRLRLRVRDGEDRDAPSSGA